VYSDHKHNQSHTETFLVLGAASAIRQALPLKWGLQEADWWSLAGKMHIVIPITHAASLSPESNSHSSAKLLSAHSALPAAVHTSTAASSCGNQRSMWAEEDIAELHMPTSAASVK